MQSFQSCDACPAAAQPRVSAAEFNLVTVVELQLWLSQVIAINKAWAVGKGNIFY